MKASSRYTVKWADKRLAAGLCKWCGLPRYGGSNYYCHLHHTRAKRLMREADRRRRSAARAGTGR
jgi:hypothetical protein